MPGLVDFALILTAIILVTATTLGLIVGLQRAKTNHLRSVQARALPGALNPRLSQPMTTLHWVVFIGYFIVILVAAQLQGSALRPWLGAAGPIVGLFIFLTVGIVLPRRYMTDRTWGHLAARLLWRHGNVIVEHLEPEEHITDCFTVTPLSPPYKRRSGLSLVIVTETRTLMFAQEHPFLGRPRIVLDWAAPTASITCEPSPGRWSHRLSEWVDGRAPVGLGTPDGEVCFVNLPSQREAERLSETLRESQAGAISLTNAGPGGELGLSASPK